MKSTMTFHSEEEMNNYFPNGIPSTVLAIVQEEGSDDAVLFATSNNMNATGTMEDMGGYQMDDEDKEKLNTAYEFATVDGASKEFVATYVSTYAPQPDLTGYATESYVVDYVAAYGGGGGLTASIDDTEWPTLNIYGVEEYGEDPCPVVLDAIYGGQRKDAENGCKVTLNNVFGVNHLTNIEITNPDWNQNDLTYLSAIKNKPFLTNTYGGIVYKHNELVPEQNINWWYYNKSNDYEVSVSPSLVSGNWNAIDEGDTIFINYVQNTILSCTYSDSDSKWHITVKNAITIWNNQSKNVIKIIEGAEKYHKGFFFTYEASVPKYKNGICTILGEYAYTGESWGTSGYNQVIIGAGGNASNTKNAVTVIRDANHNVKVFTYGVGGFDGQSTASAYTLAEVINNIETTLGTAYSVAEVILNGQSA